jgi:hypothetical protein
MALDSPKKKSTAARGPVAGQDIELDHASFVLTAAASSRRAGRT